MSLVEILPTVHCLPRADKLRLIQFLAQELAEAEDPPVLVPGEEYPVWSPYDAFDAADTLLGVLRAEDGPAG